MTYNNEQSVSSSLVIRRSSSSPIDYYTKKKIDRLHVQMDEIQMSSFIKFINHHLSAKYDEERLVKDLTTDLSNGDVFLDLIEIFSSTKLKRERGRTRFHALTNVQRVLDYLKLHMQHVNICPHEIVSGNRKQILALLWIIMKIFDFPSFRLKSTKKFFGDENDRTRILRWLNNLFVKITPEENFQIKDFLLSTWTNEKHFLDLIKFFAPITGRTSTFEYFQLVDQCQRDGQTNVERFQSILNLSEYLFHLDSPIDFNDQTEKSLLKYFVDFYSRIFDLIDNEKNCWSKELIEIESESQNDDYVTFDPPTTKPVESSKTERNSVVFFYLILSFLLIFVGFGALTFSS